MDFHKYKSGAWFIKKIEHKQTNVRIMVKLDFS